MASQEDEKAIDGLLRRSLAGRSAVTGDCPEAELLAAYFDKSLGADETARYDLHFSSCSRCREQLAMMARAAENEANEPARKAEELSLDPVLASARPVQGIAKAASTWTPAAQKAPAASIITTKPQGTHSKWIDLRWLVPVAAVLLVGTFTFFRFASRSTNVPASGEVAMSKSEPPPQNVVAPAPKPEASAREPIAGDKELKKASPVASNPSISNRPAQPASHPPASRPPASQPEPAGNTAASALSGTGAGSAGFPGSRSMRGTTARTSTFHGSYATSSRGRVIEERRSPSAQAAQADEAAPPAPAPELNASASKVPLITASADAVKSPAPPPPSEAEQKSEVTEVTTPNGFRGSSTISSLGAAKAAKTRSTIPVVIKTPDSNVMYRITGGSFVEISEDGGANWQGQRLDPPVDFVAGSAPESHVCWLVGRAGVIFLTEDGKGWQKIPAPVSKDLVAVEAQSAVSATITAKDGQKWLTDDAGKTWHTEE